VAHNYDMISWFLDEELEVCPSCGEKKLLPPASTSEQLRVCLVCGVTPESVLAPRTEDLN